MRFSIRLYCRSLAVFASIALTVSANAAKPASKASATSGAGYRFESGGWTYVHLEGTPEEIGFEHGSLLKDEIEDLLHVIQVETAHSTNRDWAFYRNAARTQLWPNIDSEYQQELEGIAKGAESKGSKLDLWDIMALDGSTELSGYYLPWLNKLKQTGQQKPGAQQKTAGRMASNEPKILPPGRCSAFIATGSYTKGGKIVIAHSNWTSYAEGSRWTVMFDIQPAHGHRILMDGAPGFITSQDDFGINSAGLMITETTITQFEGWNAKGTPEFVRSRKAMQYASSIDEYVAMMRKGNNGGYANDWLIGDRKTGEIAYLELGLKNTPLWRTRDGYFISSNFPRDPELLKTETPEFDPKNLESSPNARKVTAEKLIESAKGRIDIEQAEKFLADHEDSFTGKENADSRSLCGHVDRDPRGAPEWGNGPYFPEGAATGKVTDSDLAAKLSVIGHAGHPCGEDFLAAPFLAAHPEYNYMKPILKDMPAGRWMTFHAGEKQ